MSVVATDGNGMLPIKNWLTYPLTPYNNYLSRIFKDFYGSLKKVAVEAQEKIKQLKKLREIKWYFPNSPLF